MTIELLPLCSTGRIAIRDGSTGRYARIPLPFYNAGHGEWFASGQQFTFPGGTIGQQEGLTEQATNQKNPFIKTPGICAF